MGRFTIRMQEGYVLYVCTKFEANGSIRWKVMGVPKFRNWVTWPKLRPIRGRFMVHTQEGPSYISVPNLKRIVQFVQELLKGAQNLEIRSCDPGHAHSYGPHAGGAVLHLCTKFETICSIRSKVIKGSRNLEIRSLDPGHAHLGVGL